MRFFQITFFILFVNITYGQFVKKIVYCDQDRTLLSEENFQKLKTAYNPVIHKLEDDSLVVYLIAPIKREMNLNSDELNQVRAFLTKIIGQEFNPTKNTMLHLFEENDQALNNAINNERYWRWIKSNRRRYQAYLIGVKNSNLDKNSIDHVFYDPYNILRNFFFTNSIFKVNHVYLKPNGKVTIYFGSSDTLGALDACL